MNDPVFVEEMNAIQDLKDKSSHKVQRQSIVAIWLDKFIEVHGEQGEGHTLYENISTTLPLNKK